jgi:hypothetical protein
MKSFPEPRPNTPGHGSGSLDFLIGCVRNSLSTPGSFCVRSYSSSRSYRTLVLSVLVLAFLVVASWIMAH